jgi:hypothetical protein
MEGFMLPSFEFKTVQATVSRYFFMPDVAVSARGNMDSLREKLPTKKRPPEGGLFVTPLAQALPDQQL